MLTVQERERMIHGVERCLRRWWKVGMGCRVGLPRSRGNPAMVTGVEEETRPGRVQGENDGN